VTSASAHEIEQARNAIMEAESAALAVWVVSVVGTLPHDPREMLAKYNRGRVEVAKLPPLTEFQYQMYARV
jgi:hypothetical protein